MLNPYKMKKVDLLKFFTKRCRHSHKYYEHPNCFIIENNYAPKTGYLDIETNGFQGNFHIMLSYAIKVDGKKTILGRTITKKELQSKDIDKQLILDCIRDITKFDRIITYYGTGFDIPFIRTRALAHGIEEFPSIGLVNHTDAYYMVRGKLKLHRSSLDSVSRLLKIEGKSHVDGDIWKKASLQGDKGALNEIFKHNVADTILTEEVYNRLKDYSRETKKSL